MPPQNQNQRRSQEDLTGLPGGCGGEGEENTGGGMDEPDSRVGVGMGGEQSEVLVVGTRVAKVEVEVMKGEGMRMVTWREEGFFLP